MIGAGYECDQCTAKVVDCTGNQHWHLERWGLPEGWVQILTPDDGNREFCGWPCASMFTAGRVKATTS